MNQATSELHILFGAKTKLATLVTAGYLIVFPWVANIFNVAATTIRDGVLAPLRPLWVQYYRRVVFGGEGVVMPRSSLSFITNALIALAAIKSQFQSDHPLAIMFSVSSLIIYGLASAAELVVCCAGLDPTSVYAICAHLGKIVSLCILVVSLASLFYM